ncbi:MAG: glutathione-disulfide reductase, partial [Methylophilaceae bacterium]
MADASRWVNLIYSDSAKPAPANIPTAIFSHPEYACVGLTEEQAIQKYGQDLKIFTTQFRPMKHTLSGLSDRVWMKLLVQTSTDLVVGAHMVGDAAAEIIQG